MVSFKELPYLTQIGIVTLVIVVLATGAYLFSLRPLDKANDADALTLKAKQAEIAQLTPFRAKLAELNAQTVTLQAQMEAQRKIVPEEKEVPAFITVVATESANANVEVRRYTPKETATKDYYVEVPFEIDVDGPYYSVLNFFDRLQKLERIVNVSHLTMGALKGGKVPAKKTYKWAPSETVSASAMLTTFYSTNKGGGPPPPPVKK
jgi:type IV pilus assembly protein PilO